MEKTFVCWEPQLDLKLWDKFDMFYMKMNIYFTYDFVRDIDEHELYKGWKNIYGLLGIPILSAF